MEVLVKLRVMIVIFAANEISVKGKSGLEVEAIRRFQSSKTQEKEPETNRELGGMIDGL